MKRRPPSSKRTHALFPDRTLCRPDMVGGGAMTRGAIYYLLTNPAYRGITRHKDKRYEDTHPAIVDQDLRSEDHTSELQSLMRISYAVFCLKKKTVHNLRTPQLSAP